MKKISYILFVLGLLSLTPNSALCREGGWTGGGGDKDGLAAAAAMRRVPEILEKYGTDLVSAAEFKKIKEISMSETTLVMMKEEKLPSSVAGIQQLGTAYSVSGKKFRLSAVYRQDWRDLKNDPALQLAFMTHEVCVLIGIESTGAYGHVSAEILNRLKRHGVPPSFRIKDCKDDMMNLRSVKVGFKCRTTAGAIYERVVRLGFGEAWKGPFGAVWSDAIAYGCTQYDAINRCKRIGGKLPSRTDFQLGELTGFREVLPNINKNAAKDQYPSYWTSTLNGSDGAYFFADYLDADGKDDGADADGTWYRNTERDVRCVTQ